MTTTFDTEYSANPLNRWLARVYPINWEVVVYLVIFALAIFTRFYDVGARTMSHDESLHTKFSWDLYTNGVFAHTPLMHGPVQFHAWALSYFLFGDNDFTARIYTSVLGVGMVMFPLLFRRWLGRWGAILAALMILISPLLLYYNRYTREDTPSLFYTLVMVYCTFMYLNGPTWARRKARWLYIFSAAMLLSMGTKEVSFIYIAVFGSFLTLYWLVRLGQYFFRLPGKTLMYFLSLAVLLAVVLALAVVAVWTMIPWNIEQPLSVLTELQTSSLVRWTLLVIVALVAVVVGTLLWSFRRGLARVPWLDMLLLLALVVAVSSVFIYIEERSHIKGLDASQVDANVPGQEGEVVATANFFAWPFYALWAACIVLAALLVYSKMAGWWRHLHRFPEFDILIVMGTLVLPWLTPFVMKLMGASTMSMPSIASSVQAAIPWIQFDQSNYWTQVILSSLPVIPALALSVVAGLVWNWKRWLISAAIFYVLFLFFFTTVFTNINGIGTGMIGSLGYWLEQQAVRRGNQPQYYYLVLILPFYEFLPVIGSFLAMLAGMTFFWNYRRERIEAREGLALGEEAPVMTDGELLSVGELAFETESFDKPKRKRLPPDRLKQVPFLLFVSWWAVFNLLAYTLAGEKMPWLGTHMTLPLIFLAGWFFGGMVEKVEGRKFWEWGWLYLLLVPLLFVALAQVAAPLIFGPAPGGLQQEQLTRTFQWFGGIVIAGLVVYALYWLVQRTGWPHLRRLIGVSVFAGLALLTFRSAWMASFINYDLATEYLVYAHGAPSNKRVTEMLEDLSLRVTDGQELNFAYDFKISWPGAWYFRDFRNAVFMGESPSPRHVEDALVVIVGDENRGAVEAMLEEVYYRYDYIRLWWPMQDYFDLSAERIVNTFDFSAENIVASQLRRGLFDIWWNRDYSTYAEATGKNFNITEWPVADRMYVFVRKDIAAQMWNLGIGEGAAFVPVGGEPNICNQNWQPLTANFTVGSMGTAQGQLSFPRQVAIGLDGRIYVAEEFNHRISVFNPDGTFAFSFGSLGRLYEEGDAFFGLSPADPQAGGVFNRPNGVAVGPSGNIYVADTWNFRVQVFTPEGQYITGWGQRGEFGSGARAEPYDAFWGPRAVAVDSQEQVYVADTGNKRIRVYNQDGLWLRDIGMGGSGNGQLEEPSGLAITADGLLYVADTWNRRISVFTLEGAPADLFTNADGVPVNNFRVRAWADDQGNRPYLAVDDARRLLYVTDPDAGRVLVYDLNGSCVGSFGQLNREGPTGGQFSSVGGIATDAQGMVYVADAGSGRILQFNPFERPLPETSGQPAGAVEATPEVSAAVETTAEVTPLLEATAETTVEQTEVPAG